MTRRFWMTDADTRRVPNNPRVISKGMRARVLERDEFRCRRCGSEPAVARLVIDHVVPVAKGGQATLENLQTLCEPCNAGKSDRDPHPHDTCRHTAKPKAVAEHAAPHPLVGMFVHTFKDGKLHYQGQVLRVGNGVVVLQLFSWLTGEATNCEMFPLDDSRGWRLYQSDRDWRYGASLIQHRQDPDTYDHPDEGGWFENGEKRMSF